LKGIIMAAPFSITPSIGADLNTITLAADIAAGKVVDAAIGSQVWASDGKRYVYAQANASISASDADCTVNATTFLATASGGSYLSPPVDMATGDRGWFSVASV
jgi:hypothetical protein